MLVLEGEHQSRDKNSCVHGGWPEFHIIVRAWGQSIGKPYLHLEDTARQAFVGKENSGEGRGGFCQATEARHNAQHGETPRLGGFGRTSMAEFGRIFHFLEVMGRSHGLGCQDGRMRWGGGGVTGHPERNKYVFGLSLFFVFLISCFCLSLFVFDRTLGSHLWVKNTLIIMVYFGSEVSGFPLLCRVPHRMNWAWNSIWFLGNRQILYICTY